MHLMNKHAVRIALGLSLCLLLLQFFFRPLWRDEFWALYFSAPQDPISDAVFSKMSKDVHPPLYFSALHFWRLISENEIFARFFNLVCIFLAGWAAWRMRGTKGTGRETESNLFLFLCATSFWLIFYAAEIRMMGQLFLTSGLLVLISRNSLDDFEKPFKWASLFIIAGTLTATMHYFGSLWTACIGASLGFTHLYRGRIKSFFIFGAASVISLIPAVLWILAFRPDQASGAPDVLPPFAENFAFGANQFLRGILVKTMFANIMAFIAGCFGLAALLKRKSDDAPIMLIGAIALTILIAFTAHLGLVALIKERAFIVIIPAMLYLLAAGILSLQPHQTKALKMASWVPFAAILSLPLFTSEFFKDRERVADLQSMLQAAPECVGEPIIAYLRPSDQAEDFSAFMTQKLLNPSLQGKFNMIPLEEITSGQQSIPESACPVKIVAIALLRGEREFHEDMRDKLKSAGLPISQFEEISMGGGRTRAWVEK
ncbi:hypothetical protein [Hirschia litorea]|uniref:Glycosyltransferase RgtA/B/C/D-like domain-containing protein n=1 Tax=Hirschia litorea TaxID=1199156 RepID=A0ABW2IIS6_9PROT